MAVIITQNRSIIQPLLGQRGLDDWMIAWLDFQGSRIVSFSVCFDASLVITTDTRRRFLSAFDIWRNPGELSHVKSSNRDRVVERRQGFHSDLKSLRAVWRVLWLVKCVIFSFCVSLIESSKNKKNKIKNKICEFPTRDNSLRATTQNVQPGKVLVACVRSLKHFHENGWCARLMSVTPFF